MFKRVRGDPTYVSDGARAVDRARITLFWAAAWLAFVLMAVKVYYLTRPQAVPWADEQSVGYIRLLAGITYGDVIFAAGLWLCGRAALALAGRRRAATRIIGAAFIACAAIAGLY